jgi:hypothetical protein
MFGINGYNSVIQRPNSLFQISNWATYDYCEDDEVSSSKMPDIYDIKVENDVDTYDQYFGSHVRVPIGDEIRSGKVVGRKRDLDGTVRG